MTKAIFIFFILSQLLLSRTDISNEAMPTNNIMSIIPKDCDNRCLKRATKKRGDFFIFKFV